MKEISNFIYTAKIGSNRCYGAVAKMIIECRNYIFTNSVKLNVAISSTVAGNPINLIKVLLAI